MPNTCGHCQRTNFPEGMLVWHCPVCDTHIHPGCWDAHEQRHRAQGEVTTELLTPRRGKIHAYGIIQWDT